uniref:hypothetical protein n=1 Tax=Lentibacillus jeotgali TaxID=558169 RepID=UPI0002627404
KTEINRGREYLASIILFIVFSAIIFIFDLPNKVFAFIGILAVSDVVLYEVLNIKNNEIKT